jgi:hypothetical protein
VERADFERFESHVKEWGKVAGAGCVYLAQRKISGFSYHGFSEE